MRLIVPTLAAMISLSAADFLIYSFEDTNAGEVYNAFLFLKGEPDCADVCDEGSTGGWLTQTEDASGGGARCKTPKEAPFGCTGGEGEILELEMNSKWSDPPIHFTIYKERGYEMEPAGGGASLGKCTPTAADTYQCVCFPNGKGGRGLFSCKSELTPESFIPAK